MAIQRKQGEKHQKQNYRFGSPEWRKWIAKVIECWKKDDLSPISDHDGKITLSINDIIFIHNVLDGHLSLEDVERFEKEKAESQINLS